MRKAEELIKASPESVGKTVTIKWLQKERHVAVNDVVAVVQPPGEAKGFFKEPFMQLVLP